MDRIGEDTDDEKIDRMWKTEIGHCFFLLFFIELRTLDVLIN